MFFKVGIAVAIGLLAPLFAWLMVPALVVLAAATVMSLPILALIVICKRAPGVSGSVVAAEARLDALDISGRHAAA
jgi:hypothetical protein